MHSDFSLLDGASQLPSLVARAAELKVPALALTDHGVLYGAVQLVRTCDRHGVKPIIGNEMYLVNDPLDGEEPDDPKAYKAPKRYHLIVLAKNTVGYRNLVKLTSMAHLEGKVGRGIFARPCINKAQLFEHREGLIISSACLGGEIPQAILNDDLDAARTVAMWYRDAFGDDFYLEIQDHGSEEDKKVNPHMIRLSRELGIKAIATNDSHFTSCLDAEAHDALICIQTGKRLSDENRLHYAGNEYFKSIDEMRECFVDHLPRDAIDDALVNTLGVAEKVEKYDLFGETRIPDFPIPNGFDGSLDTYLAYVAWEGLAFRLKARQKAGLADSAAEQQYHERLDLELKMIQQMGFSSYFLVVWDYIRHAKDLNIPVGPGRGSAAGSLVAFALRITDVDPIAFNLLFERFLNPERKSMPDIDTDFSVKGREEIISYVSERYGLDRVAQIITFNRLTSKAVLKDVARVHEVPYAEADRLAKLIPVVRGKPATLTKLLSKDTPSPDFKKLIEKNPPYKTWIDKAMRIEGTNKTYGIHAAGVVISASPLTDIVPLSRAKHGEIITQYAMEDVESLGLLKMDFLGLKNLTVIETALRFINEGRRQKGIVEDLDFSVDALPLDDKKTYKLLSEGELDGIFQLDASGGMRNIVRELRPSSLEDISSILALYRPGPLDAGLIPKFINRKHGKEAIEYDHPLLEPILRETYGIMVYQEQIMRIARDLAGYSLGQADILRRAMGKKKTADMEREKPRFIAGAQQNGVSEEKAADLFDMMIKFAEYCFNKSHSTAYAYLTYQTAYLKANYPVEYSAALLRSNMNQSDKLVRYLADANISGVRVAPPAVNKSDLGFTVDRTKDDEGVVLFGLEAVKTVGESVAHALLNERTARGPFLNIIDLIERVNLRVLNKRAMGALIHAGAFDELHHNRKVLFEALDKLLALRRKLRDRKKRRESKNLTEEEEQAAADADALEWEQMEVQLENDSNEVSDFSQLERLAGEKATLGFYASGHPLYDLKTVAQTLDCTRVDHIQGDTTENEGAQLEEGTSIFSNALSDGSDVMILSCITDLKKITTAKGKKMAKWMIEDAAARVPGIVFPSSYDIVEQVRERPNDTIEITNAEMSQVDSSTDLEHAEPSFVVEEDARVLVWGKVDLESSGTAQVIIDDVQRVEDVKFILVTAPYSGMRTPRFNRQILRDCTAHILEVDLFSDSSSKYLDPNGIVRRRRARTIPVSKKSRIPMILQCLDENGVVCSRMNVGNALRFPTDCVDLLRPLQENTGFKVELLSVSEHLFEAETMASEELLEADLTSHVDRKENRFDVPGPEHLEHNSVAYEDTFEDTSLLQDVSANAIQDSDVQDITSVTTRDEAEELENTPPVGSLDNGGETQDVSNNEQGDENVFLVGDIQMTREEHMEYRASSRIALQERQSEELMSRREKSLRATLSVVGKMPTPTLTLETTESVYNGTEENRSSSTIVATVERPATVVEDAIESSTNFDQYSESISYSQALKRARERGMHGSSREGTQEDKDDMQRSQDEKMDIVGDDRSQSQRYGMGENTKNPSISIADFVPVAAEGCSQDAMTTAQGPGAPTDMSPTKPNRSIASNINRCLEHSMTPTEVEVDFRVGQIGALLDAIALVGGGAVRAKCNCLMNVSGITGLDMSKVTEDHLALKVSGRVAFVDKKSSFVLVDVKEVERSGKRKRTRSFGPVVCILRTDTVGTALAMKTKKAKKDFESVKTKVGKAADDIARTVLRRGKSLKIPASQAMGSNGVFTSSNTSLGVMKLSEDLNAASLCDGGEVLLSLTRAAEMCVDKCCRTDKSRVTVLDGFLVSDPQVLALASSIEVQVHFEGTLLGDGRVQAEAKVESSDGHSISCWASFSVSNPGLEGRNALPIVVDEDPLFRRVDVAERFRECSQCLTV